MFFRLPTHSSRAEDEEDSKLALLTPDERETLDLSPGMPAHASIGMISADAERDQQQQQLGLMLPTKGLGPSSSGGPSTIMGGEQLQILHPKGGGHHSRNNSSGSGIGMISALGSTSATGGGLSGRGSGGASDGDGAGKGVAGLAGRLLRVASVASPTHNNASNHDKAHELQQRSPLLKVSVIMLVIITPGHYKLLMPPNLSSFQIVCWEPCLINHHQHQKCYSVCVLSQAEAPSPFAQKARDFSHQPSLSSWAWGSSPPSGDGDRLMGTGGNSGSSSKAE